MFECVRFSFMCGHWFGLLILGFKKSWSSLISEFLPNLCVMIALNDYRYWENKAVCGEAPETQREFTRVQLEFTKSQRDALRWLMETGSVWGRKAFACLATQGFNRVSRYCSLNTTVFNTHYGEDDVQCTAIYCVRHQFNCTCHYSCPWLWHAWINDEERWIRDNTSHPSDPQIRLSPIQMIIVSHVDVCKSKLAWAPQW